MKLRIVRDVLVLAALGLLPWAAAGCASAVARGSVSQVNGYKTPPATSGAPTPYVHDARGPGGAMTPLVPAQSMPAPEEELWVIQRRRASAEAAGDEQVPGSGSLFVPRGDRLVPIPLKHTDVKASIAGYVGTVDVTQQFQNPYDGKIEAVYVFPLPHNAAVNEFVMTVGERRIRGIVREREEAKQIYEQAKGQGYVASLLEQDRPNVFTQKVANIEPGKQIDVSVRYFHTLSYADGWYEWAFPMVVGPRFNPPGTTDGVGAAPRGAPGTSKQKAEVPYLRPGERSGHDIALSVRLVPGVIISELKSTSHAIEAGVEGAESTKLRVGEEVVTPAGSFVDDPNKNVWKVSLAASDAIPNRDFVLRWKVAGEGIKAGLVLQRDKDGNGGYFAMMLVPPEDVRRLPRAPVEMVFTLDVSGSMAGRPIEQAKSAVRWALAHLRPDDTLQVVRFAGGAEQMAERPVPATPQNVRRATRYVEGTAAGGGTMMLEGLRKALQAPSDDSRPRYVVFLTDGFIGNESEILGALKQSLGGSRVFSVGVGSATNRYLLEHMAKLGRGAVAFLGPRDNAEEVMAGYFGAISHPAMTDLSIDWGGSRVADVYPQRLPDLFVGRAVTIVGRYEGEAPRQVKVNGRVRGDTHTVEATASAAAAAAALSAVWARAKIADLGDRLALDPRDPEVPTLVRQVALEHGLMSAYTSFVAVDALTRTRGDHGTTVATPVPVPEGVRYETSVTER
jgi:Ca-activated chloride channel family protein